MDTLSQSESQPQPHPHLHKNKNTLKFTDSHEWIKLEGNEIAIATLGITPYAQKELGDIVYIELPIVGKFINAKQEVAVLESTKAAVDIYSPISGVITEINDQLKTAPELINHSPDDKGWICKVRLSDLSEVEQLMSEAQYRAMIGV